MESNGLSLKGPILVERIPLPGWGASDEGRIIYDTGNDILYYGDSVRFVQVRLPAGTLIMWPGETQPDGYLECNGTSLLRAGPYAALFSAISTVYGAADGTHFNIPDYRGIFLRAWDHGIGRDVDRAGRVSWSSFVVGATMAPGDHVGTYQGDMFRSHAHDTYPLHAGSYSNNDNGGSVSDDMVLLSTGSAGGNETRPINTYVMVCIKY